jgi:AbrB family looped-hinge helix DNA binding protein
MIRRHQSVRVRVGQRGTIVIPAEMRRDLDLQVGDELDVVAEGEALHLTKVDDDPIAQLREIAAPYFAGVDPVAFQRELRDDGP